MKYFDYHKPRTLAEALELKKKIPGSRFVAGGTDLLVQIKSRTVFPEALISLRSVAGLSSIEINGEAKIGALVTASDLLEHPGIQSFYPLLSEAARHLGSPQIRNVATIGGNLCNCSPCADLALALLVLEAGVKISGADGSRVIPVEDFFVGPGVPCLSPEQVLTEILLKPPSDRARTVFYKKGRVKLDLAIASTAVLLEMEEETCRKARIAAGSAAPVPLRLTEVESLLEQKALSPELADQAQSLARKIVSPITDVRGSEEYRREIVGVFVKRSIEHIAGWSAR